MAIAHMDNPTVPLDHDSKMNDSDPWAFLRAFGLPNVKWCEAQNPSWVIEPANTWSNLAFVIAGLLMILWGRRAKSPWLRLYGPSMVLLGVFSGLYHASYTYLLQIADFVGMYLVLLCPLFFGIERLGVRIERPFRSFALTTIGITILTVALFAVGLPIQILVALLAVAIIGTEVRLWRRGADTNRPFFFAGIAFLVVGETFSFLDVSRQFCHPEDHLIQGHAVHHVMVALCFLFNFFYCRQIASEPTASTSREKKSRL